MADRVRFDVNFHVPLLLWMARAGATEQQMADTIGVNRVTIQKWKKTYSSVNRAIRGGRDWPDAMVEHSLYKSAVGHTVTTATEQVLIDPGTGKEFVASRTVVKREVPPNPYAAIKWLTNRRKHDWKDNPDSAPPSDILVGLPPETEDAFDDAGIPLEGPPGDMILIDWNEEKDQGPDSDGGKT